jgi:hypothetical protein
VLRSDRFQPIWIEANRRAHQQAMAILEGRSQVIATAGDHVDIDLLPLVNEVLRLISAQLPTLFGHQLSLPDISSGEIPANLRTVVQNQLGVQLPANFAQFAVYDGGQLAAAQQALVEARRGVALLVVTTVVLLGLALAVSPARRRTLLQLGLWLVVAAIAVTASLRAVRAQLVAQVPEGTYRSGVESAVTIVTATLRERGVQIIWVGALLALVAYLVGPGRVPVWLRRQAAAVARTIGGAVRRAARFAVRRGPGWIVGHLDVLRIAGLVVAGVAALVLSSWSSLLVVILVLAGYEVAVTVIARTTASPVDGVASPVAGAAGPAAS